MVVVGGSGRDLDLGMSRDRVEGAGVGHAAEAEALPKPIAVSTGVPTSAVSCNWPGPLSIDAGLTTTSEL